MLMLESEALSGEAWRWFGGGLGAAFAITIVVIVLLFLHSAFAKNQENTIDLGFLGLIVLLVTIFYMIAFSFLVAASTKGLDIKLLVAAVDAFVLIGGKLLAPEFLRYLNDEAIGGGAKPRNTVWIHIEPAKPVDDRDYVKVFADQDDAECWVEEHKVEGAPFECLIMEEQTSSADACDGKQETAQDKDAHARREEKSRKADEDTPSAN
jgi:hypothetical protein